ncbi:MAG TPA: L-histidine N(alpha)-methyltransferase [Casimicrobiaceae bacterium]|nr:L-histidine N(alpha)-methyltransferase [Casimicrobiaceae bacterium]
MRPVPQPSYANAILRASLRDGRVVDRRTHHAAAERRALVAGLLASPASVAPRYFYDARGCALFAQICRLPEYYPTRTESAIFESHRDAIAACIGSGKEFVDLGAGDCAKGARWLPSLAPWRYLAVDIAADELAESVARLSDAFPDVDVRGVVTDFAHGLDLFRDLSGGAVTFFYPGSSIGNFTPLEAARFLHSIRRHCRDDDSGLLIGVDTKKEVARLEAAYDDAAGVTAAFNRNALSHVNRVLGTNFVSDAFTHVAFYNARDSRVEMHLEARSRQTVIIDGIERTFEAGERIHTENSYKYAPAEFEAMLERAGFSRVRTFDDDAGDYAVYCASVR